MLHLFDQILLFLLVAMITMAASANTLAAVAELLP